MRTTTAAQEVVLALPNRATHLRVLIDRGAGDWVDLSTLEGRDWVKDAAWGDSEDASVVTAEVKLWSKVDSLSLAPLVDGSKLNAGGTIVDLGNPIRIEVAVMPQDCPPSAADWVEAFRGEIDEIDWQASPMVVRCRDKGGQLDAVIETQSKRPFNLTVAPVEQAMQEILDGVFGEGVVTLYSINGTAATPFPAADSPGWYIPEYIQQKQPVLQALRVLSDQIGWYLRHVWNTSTGAFELTLYEPPRERAARGTLSFSGQPVAAQTWVLNATTITARAAGAGADEFNIGTTVLETCANVVACLLSGSESANVAGAWVAPARCHVGTLTFTGQPIAAETVTIAGHVLTAVAAGAAGNQFNVGGATVDTLNNLVQCINLTSTLATLARATRVGLTVLIQWLAPGSAAQTFTEALTNCTANGAGFLGGTVLGIDGGVVVEWGTKGVAGNAIVFTEALTNVAIDGAGFLGGTRLGAAAGGDTRTFGPGRYFAPSKVSMSRAGIRNAVRVKYGVSQLDRTTIDVEDAASIAKYGRRFMEVAEASSSQIDTEGEARLMADAILSDLKKPGVDLVVPVPFFWPVELTGDTYTFEADGEHFDTDQSLAVVGYRHSVQGGAGGKARTEIAMRGKPSGGNKRWLELEARPGVAPQNSFYQGAAAEGVTAAAGQGVVIVTYDDPRGMSPPINDWAFTRCFIDTSGSGFTPSDANLADIGRVLRFEIAGLVPGETYYVKLQIVDGAGNVALTTTAVVIAAEKTTAYHEDSDTITTNLLPNGTFGQFVKGANLTPPDGWSLYAGVWGTDIYADDETQDQSGCSIAMGPDGAVDGSGLLSDFVPISEWDIFRLKSVSNDSTITASIIFTIVAQFFDSTKTLIGTRTVLLSTSLAWVPVETWQTIQSEFAVFGAAGYANARYLKIGFYRADPGASGHILRVDTMVLVRDIARFRAYRNATQSINSSTWTRVQFNTESYDVGAGTTRARGTLTLTGNPVAAQTFVVNATTCTARAAGAGADEFNIGTTKEETAANIVAMLNAGSEAANVYAWRLGARVLIEWRTAGAAGNAITLTEALTNATADGGGTLGGTLSGGIVYGHDNATNVGRLTVLQAGYYSFSAAVGLTALADGDTAELAFYLNGAAVAGGTLATMGGAGNVRLVASAQLSLARGDYVEVYVWHDNAAARNTVAGAAETYFMGTRIGAGE